MSLKDRITSLVLLITVGGIIAGMWGINNPNAINCYWRNYPEIGIIIGGLIAIMLIILISADFIEEKWTAFLMKKRHLTGNIISRRIESIKIMDNDGKRARYFEEIYISKINKNSPLSTILKADEKIHDSRFDMDSAQLNNCIIKSSNNNKTVRVLYIDDSISDGSLHKKKVKKIFDYDKYCGYSIEFINSFTDTSEDYWMISFKTYTQEYKISIELPPNRKIKSAILYKIEKDRDGKDTESVAEFTTPIIHNNINLESSIITLQINNYDSQNSFVLRWKYLNKKRSSIF